MRSDCSSEQLICWMKGNEITNFNDFDDFDNFDDFDGYYRYDDFEDCGRGRDVNVCFSVDIFESQKWKQKYKERRIFVTRFMWNSVESSFIASSICYLSSSVLCHREIPRSLSQ